MHTKHIQTIPPLHLGPTHSPPWGAARVIPLAKNKYKRLAKYSEYLVTYKTSAALNKR